MFENNTNAADVVSRRSVLKTTGGLLAGSTALAGLGAGRGAAETEEGLQIEVREFTEEVIAVEVVIPEAVYSNDMDLREVAFLGHAERFVIHDDTVSLPEETEGLANPVEAGGWEHFDGETYRVMLSFRTADVDLPKDEEVMLGLGLFPERTVPHPYFDACPGHRDY